MNISIHRIYASSHLFTWKNPRASYITDLFSYTSKSRNYLESFTCIPQFNMNIPFEPVLLGETLLCIITSTSTTPEKPFYNIRMSLHMNTSGSQNTQTIPLQPNDSSLLTDRSTQWKFSYEVKNLGHHQLVCSLSFEDNQHQSHTMKKEFTFTVQNPLSIRTKITLHPTVTYLEVQMKNESSLLLEIESIELESSMTEYTVKSFVPSTILLDPDDIYQIMFHLSPKNEQNLFSNTALGVLDIFWISQNGSKGRLQTNQLHKKASLSPISLVLETLKCFIGIPFSLSVLGNGLITRLNKIVLGPQQSSCVFLLGNVQYLSDNNRLDFVAFPHCSGIQRIHIQWMENINILYESILDVLICDSMLLHM